jgi:hypothetical protein
MKYDMAAEARFAHTLARVSITGRIDFHLFGITVVCPIHHTARMEALTVITFCWACRAWALNPHQIPGRSIRP